MADTNDLKIDTIPAGAVVFISSPKTVNAVYGGLMSTRAQASGAVGTVVDGTVRDLQEHRGLGFPVSFSKVQSFTKSCKF
jgi:regulator of RNase E activity RraA